MSTQTVVSCLCWCVEPHFFFTPFAGLTKGWIFVFLPWGGSQVGNHPPPVAVCGLSSAEACCCCCCSCYSSSSSNASSASLASASDSMSVSATRISLMVSSSSLIFSQPLLNTYNGLPYVDSFLWLGTVAETKCHEDTSFFHGDSKTGLKLWCDCRIKFQLLEGVQDVFSRLAAVYCMLLSQNPYTVPQHYKRHVCGASCSCKRQFLWIFLIFEH